MKKTYTTPEVTVEELFKQDVLCASEIVGENRRAAYDEFKNYLLESNL